MCGIAGVFNFGGTPRDEMADLCRVRDAMIHRGPDSAGYYQSQDRRVALVHRRLSIVDLSEAGHQPMTNEDGTIWITFNGEIYNHQCLRQRLEAKHHKYQSHSDTESIIHLYEEQGPDCVAQLDGMFAFAIWDESKRMLLLARDHMGKKPLYYTRAGGKLLFASEIKALLEYPDVKRNLNLEALNYYLTFSNVPAPLTLFDGIHKLPPAHLMTCNSRGDISIRRYWSPLDGPGWQSDVDETESTERVLELVRRAVAKRLMSDVPIGAFLSGGIDSSTNVALMSQLVSEPLRTFSLGFEGFGAAENFHDLPYARRIAKQFGCDHHEVTVTAAECRDYVPNLAWQQDEPIGDPACLPMHFVSRAARQDGVVVVLVGEGSDEVFGGYEDFSHELRVYNGRWRQLNRLPRLARQLVHFSSRAMGLPDGRVDVLRRAADNDPMYWGLDVVFWDTEKARLLRPAARSQMGSGSASLIRNYYREILARRPQADFMQQMSYVELSNRLPELLLMRVDKFSMAHSLEARAPFLDHELVSYVLSLPQHLKLNGTTKRVLKKAVAGILPEDVIGRRKQGFRVPLPAWLRGDLSSWAEHQLFSSPLRKLDLFDFDYITTLWQRHQSGRHDHSFDLWCLINLSSWYERWLA